MADRKMADRQTADHETADREVVIGLEVHAQLSTASKIFSSSSTAFGERPNLNTDPVCLGLPGTLPVLNRRAVEHAIRLGLSLGCRIADRSEFARKNYFYPDVPKNYQISQYDRPLCEGGEVEIEVDDQRRRVPLERIHLEEDAGRSVHDGQSGRTWVDLNRAGTPLVEIVTLPALRSPAEAGAYLESLRQLVRWLDICDGNMEEGSLRCDANISLRRTGDAEMGTKVEIKNLNSIRGVVAALEHEIIRQGKRLDRGETVHQETRGWDPQRQVTVFQRGKESAHDYRYFPDPDLPPLIIEPGWRESIAAELPELPRARRDRLREEYHIPAYDAAVLTESRALSDYFEAVATDLGDPKAASNWVMGELMRLLNERNEEIEDFSLPPGDLAELLRMVQSGRISGKIAKEVFEEMVQTGLSAAAIVQRRGLTQITDPGQLSRQIEEILDGHPEQVEQYLGGKEGVLGYFVGQLMKATRGQAHPQLANRLLREALDQRRPS